MKFIITRKLFVAAFLGVISPYFALTADTNALPQLAPAHGELPATFWEQHQSVIIVAGFAFLAVILLSLQVMLRPKTPVVLPPEAIARQALAKLQGRPEDGKMLSELSQILRQYICAAFELPSAEMTTAEFSATLAANGKAGDELARAISSFLRECDEWKFSPTTIIGSFNAVDRAQELVSRSEARRAQFAATNPPQK